MEYLVFDFSRKELFDIKYPISFRSIVHSMDMNDEHRELYTILKFRTKDSELAMTYTLPGLEIRPNVFIKLWECSNSPEYMNWVHISVRPNVSKKSACLFTISMSETSISLVVLETVSPVFETV